MWSRKSICTKLNHGIYKVCTYIFIKSSMQRYMSLCIFVFVFVFVWEEKCRIGTEEEKEWYFFSHKDKKYPTGTRTNRATTAGFWKATGRDKPIYSKRNLVGMRKTLVYYKGRAPNGQKSDWIIHEYRVQTDINGNPQVFVDQISIK